MKATGLQPKRPIRPLYQGRDRERERTVTEAKQNQEYRSAFRRDGTDAELASHYRIHPNMIAKWKRAALDSVKDGFARGRSDDGRKREAEIRTLRAKIGELVVERDFFGAGLPTRFSMLQVNRHRWQVTSPLQSS